MYRICRIVLPKPSIIEPETGSEVERRDLPQVECQNWRRCCAARGKRAAFCAVHGNSGSSR